MSDSTTPGPNDPTVRIAQTQHKPRRNFVKELLKGAGIAVVGYGVFFGGTKYEENQLATEDQASKNRALREK